jgi:hypothetical protein
MAWRDTEGQLHLVFCDDGRESEMEDEGGNDMEDTSGYEKSGCDMPHLVEKTSYWCYNPSDWE